MLSSFIEVFYNLGSPVSFAMNPQTPAQVMYKRFANHNTTRAFQFKALLWLIHSLKEKSVRVILHAKKKFSTLNTRKH